MNQSELLQKIRDAEKQIADARRMLEEYRKNGAVRPKNGDGFYYITQRGEILSTIWTNDPADEDKFKIGNVFYTKDDVERAVRRLKTHQKLKEFAYKYNDGEVIEVRDRHCLGYDLYSKELCSYCVGDYMTYNNIYFKDEYFLSPLLKEIPKDELIEYCKGG